MTFMVPFLAAFGLGGTELILIVLAVLILFGAKKIPDFAKGLGQGIKEFKKASREVQEEIERAGEELNPPPPPRPPLSSGYTPPAESVHPAEPVAASSGSTPSEPSSNP